MKKIQVSVLIFLFLLINSIIIYINKTLEIKIINYIILLIISIILYCFIRKVNNSKKFNKIYDLVLLVAICIIVFEGIISFDFLNDSNNEEKREKAMFPKVNIFHENFADQMDDYINDRIGLRNTYIYMKKYFTHIEYINLTNKYIEGIKPWLFYNDFGNDYLYYAGAKKYEEENIKNITKIIENNLNFCKKNKIKLILVVPPNKSTIYGEYYNKNINKITDKENYLVLREIMHKNFPEEDVLFFYDELQDAKKTNTLYFKTGTHWNSYGAYTAYNKIAKIIKHHYPAYNIINYNDIYVCNREKFIDKWLQEISGSKYEENKYGLCTKQSDILQLTLNDGDGTTKLNISSYGQKKAPSIMLIHDSFMVELAPFIEKGASSISSIWTYNYDFNNMSDKILKSKPEIIIWETLEMLWYGF